MSQRAHTARRTHSRTGRRGAVLTRIAGTVRQASRGSVVITIDVRRHGHWNGVKRMSLNVTSAGRFLSLLRLRAGARYRVGATYTGASPKMWMLMYSQ